MKKVTLTTEQRKEAFDREFQAHINGVQLEGQTYYGHLFKSMPRKSTRRKMVFDQLVESIVEAKDDYKKNPAASVTPRLSKNYPSNTKKAVAEILNGILNTFHIGLEFNNLASLTDREGIDEQIKARALKDLRELLSKDNIDKALVQDFIEKVEAQSLAEGVLMALQGMCL